MTMMTFTLDAAELAVLAGRMLGQSLVVPADSAGGAGSDAQAGRVVTAEQLAAAADELLERRYLVRAPGEAEAAVANPIATVLGTALGPERVAVLRTARPDRPAQQVIFSFSPTCIARNHVDAAGRHIFAELVDTQEAVAQITAETESLVLIPAPPAGEPQPAEVLLRGAQLVALLLSVDHPGQPQPVSRGLSWLVAHRAAWLIDPMSDPDRPLAHPAGPAELRQAVAAALA